MKPKIAEISLKSSQNKTAKFENHEKKIAFYDNVSEARSELILLVKIAL